MTEFKMMQRLRKPIDIVVEVADHEHHRTPWNALGDEIELLRKRALAAGLEIVHRLENAAYLRLSRARRDINPWFIVKGRKTDRILLPDEQIGERRGQIFAVFEFAYVIFRPPPGVAHRAARVQDHRRS